MSVYDPNKTIPIITTDWTQMDGRSKPFFQPAITGSNPLPDRYSVVVVSPFTTTGGSELDTRLQMQVTTGVSRILKYYNKQTIEEMNDPSSSVAVTEAYSYVSAAVKEDYYIPPRPKARMKVLISLPCDKIDQAPEKNINLNSLPLFEELELNTSQLEEKIDIANKFINDYHKEVERFHGKLYGINLARESTKLLSFVSTLKNLMTENDFYYHNDKSDLIMVGIDENYRVLYVQVNDGSGFTTLSKGFNNFLENKGVKNDRTIYLLSKLNEIERIFIDKTPLSWSNFFKRFILNPPEIDFTKPRPQSYKVDSKVAKAIKEHEEKLAISATDEAKYELQMNSTEFRTELSKELEAAQEFVGDEIFGSLNNLSETITEVDKLYTELLGKIGLNELIDSALECLDIDKVDYFDISKDFLNLADSSLEEIQAAFRIPTIDLPDDFPVVDYMGEMIKEIIMNTLKTIANTLVSMVLDMIKALFDFCKECSFIDEKTGAKRYDNLNFGAFPSFGNILGAAVASPLATKRLAAATIQGLGITSEFAEDSEAAAQQVLKNSVNNIDQIYDAEAARISTTLRTGTAADEISTGALFTGTSMYEEILRRGKHGFWQGPMLTKEDLIKAGFTTDMTLEQIREIVVQRSPWSSEVFKEAAKDLTGYLDAVNAATTPGEIANLMIGCNTSSDVKEVARNALPEYPSVCLLLCADNQDDTDDNVSDLFETIGKYMGNKEILNKISEISNAIPKEFECLDSENDEDLRKSLLGQKDPSMTRDQIDDMVAKSNNLKEKRLRDLAKELKNDDFWKGRMPPINCTASADGTIIPGLSSGDPPITYMMMKEALDVPFDSLHMTFVRDINKFIPSLSVQTSERVIVPRTKKATITLTAGGVENLRVMNPRFEKLVSEGRVTWGSLPAGAIVPGSKEPPDPDEDPDDWDNGDTIDYIPWLAAWGFNGYANYMGAGQWDEGQTRPTANQEYEWEKANTFFSASYQEIAGSTLPSGFKISGGREFNNVKPDYRLGETWDDKTLSSADYAKSFGYSPIPVYDYDMGQRKFIPGLRDTYKNICNPSENLFNIEPVTNSEQSQYVFVVRNNLIKESNFSIDAIQENFKKAARGELGGEIMDNPLGGSSPDQAQFKLDGDLFDKISKSITTLQNSNFEIKYSVGKVNPGHQAQIPNDTFSLDLSLIPASAVGQPSATAIQQLNLVGPPESVPLQETIPGRATIRVINDKSLDIPGGSGRFSNQKIEPQNGYLYSFIKDSWTSGASIYRNGTRLDSAEQPATADGFLSEQQGSDLLNFLWNENSYQEMFKDLFCSFTNQISDSPYVNLLPDDEGRGMSTVQFNPKNIVGKPKECSQTLMDIDIVKERVIEEYNLLKCIRDSFPDVTGLGSNKNVPFEVSKRAGIVLLTVRIHVLEYLLRSIYGFHYFVPSSPSDVDQTAVYYVFNKINVDLANRSIGISFYEDFQKETIEFYNRNHPKSERLSLDSIETGNPPHSLLIRNYVNFKQAMYFMIRLQIYSVSKRLSNLVDIKGDGSPHSVLLQQWLPLLEPPKNFGEARFANDDGTNKTLKNYDEGAGIPTVDQEVIDSVLRGGELSEERIEFISGTPGSGDTPRMLLSMNTGRFFREYFSFAAQSGGNQGRQDAARTHFESALNTSLDNKDLLSHIRSTAKALWPASGDNNQLLENWHDEEIMNGDFPGGYTAREAHLFHLQSAPHQWPSTFGQLWSATTTAGYLPRLGAKGVTPAGQLQWRYWFGIAPQETHGMDSLIKFIEAAKFWTLGPATIANRPRAEANFGFSWGNITPWWFQTHSHNHDSRIGRFYSGPGSLLWARSKGVGVFAALKHVELNHTSGKENLSSSRVEYLFDWWRYVTNGLSGGSWYKQVEDALFWSYGNTRGTGLTSEQQLLPYISLLDLSPTMILKTLEWERDQYELMIRDMRRIRHSAPDALSRLPGGGYESHYCDNHEDLTMTTTGIASHKNVVARAFEDSISSRGQIPTSNLPQVQKLQGLINKYNDEWIPGMQQIIGQFSQAEEVRRCMAAPVAEIARTARVPRNEMRVPLMYDIDNGSLIQEVYIRTEDYENEIPPEILNNVNYVKQREDIVKGVVNIDKWDEYLRDTFTAQSGKLPRELTQTKQDTSIEDCGVLLPTQYSVTAPRPGWLPEAQLQDYFKRLSFGLRISYVPKPGPFSADGRGPLNGLRNSAKFQHPLNEKSYFVTETVANTGTRTVTPMPLVSVEIPINMEMKISDAVRTHQDVGTDPAYWQQQCGVGVRTDAQTTTTQIGHFRHLFKTPQQAAVMDSAPNRQLQKQILATDEYSFLFKYSLPLDRMLSLTQIYSSTYLSTMPNHGSVFDPTKEKLMYIYLNSTRSLNKHCNPSSKDYLDGLLNGLKPPYAAILELILKTPLMIFKGYVEASDPNVMVSKNIQNAIKALNSIIATAQRQANAVARAAQQQAAAIGRLADISFEEQECGFGIHSPEAMQQDPSDLFEPIEDNLIYVPETWMLGLALLPPTIFGPWSPGIPVNLLTGIPYWILDQQAIGYPVNWFNSFDIKDWIDELLKDDKLGNVNYDDLSCEQPTSITNGLLPPGTYNEND